MRVKADWGRVVNAALELYERIDVLVNNAGITGFEGASGPHDPEHATGEAWRAVHASNLDGVFLGCKHAIRAMRRTSSGSIINIGKRNPDLNATAISCAERILAAANEQAGGERGGDSSSRAARWVATDTLRELTSEKVQARLEIRRRRRKSGST